MIVQIEVSKWVAGSGFEYKYVIEDRYDEEIDSADEFDYDDSHLVCDDGIDYLVKIKLYETEDDIENDEPCDETYYWVNEGRE